MIAAADGGQVVLDLGTAASTCSTFASAALVVASRVPTGSSWSICRAVLSLNEPRKSVFSKVAEAMVPTKINTARQHDDQGRRSAEAQHRQVATLQPGHLVLGVGVRIRSAHLGRGACAARRNQYASTGTMVSETSSDAPRAIATVTAKGRNSSPRDPDDQGHRHEHRHGGQRRGGDRSGHLA